MKWKSIENQLKSNGNQLKTIGKSLQNQWKIK